MEERGRFFSGFWLGPATWFLKAWRRRQNPFSLLDLCPAEIQAGPFLPYQEYHTHRGTPPYPSLVQINKSVTEDAGLKPKRALRAREPGICPRTNSTPDLTESWSLTGNQRPLVRGRGTFPGGQPDQPQLTPLFKPKMFCLGWSFQEYSELYGYQTLLVPNCLHKHLLFFRTLLQLVSFMILTMTLVVWQGRYDHSNLENGAQMIGFT